MAHAGTSSVLWSGIVGKVLAPSIAAPIFALVIAALATSMSRRLTKKSDNTTKSWGMKAGQIGSSSLLSIAARHQRRAKDHGGYHPRAHRQRHPRRQRVDADVVVLLCGIAIGLGTYFGGWRIIRTMGQGFTRLSPTQGFASQITSSAVILTSSHFGMPLSTTYVATGSILGSGIGTKKRSVRWSLAGRVGLAWLITLPCAGACGAAELLLRAPDGVLTRRGRGGPRVGAVLPPHLPALTSRQDQRQATSTTSGASTPRPSSVRPRTPRRQRTKTNWWRCSYDQYGDRLDSAH